MHRRCLAALLCILLIPAGQAVGQEAGAAAKPASAVAVPGVRHPLLWKVSDADNSVYLLGSFHMLKPEDLPLSVEVDRAFDDSTSLLFEVEPAAMTAPESAAIAQKYMGYDDGRTLSSVISKATAQRLGTLLSASGGSLQLVEAYEPWAVGMSLTLQLMQAMGYRSDLGVDKWMMDRAATAGKPAGGLETAEDGFKALDGVPYPEQVRDLDEFLNDPQKVIARLRAMHDWWRAGDAVDLERQMREELMEKAPETYRLVVVQRNRNWLPQVERRLTEGHKDNTLVVVGAMHLLGADGLVEQLRAKGYKVERMCDGCEVAEAAR